MSEEIEQAIAEEDWDSARALILAALFEKPDSHWLLTRLGLTYYEQRNYSKALEYSELALELAPECPLALWDYAGSLEMLGRTAEALSGFRKLVFRGIEPIAYGDCGEGLSWARGLVADCHYRMAHCYIRLGRRRRAVAEFRRHLTLRGPMCESIYPVATVRRELKQAQGRE